jgi:hypothetical protein
MPTFDTPEPIELRVDLGLGDLWITASDRADTVVEVLAGHSAPSSGSVAEQTVVAYADGVLQIRAPKGWKRYTPWGGSEAIDVRVEVPNGSRLRGGATLAPLRGAGTLGACHYRTGGGDITVEHVTGPMVLRTGSGAVRVARVGGSATVKNGNGDTWIGDVAGDVQLQSANGTISVDRARAAVTAKTANGDVLLGEVARGEVVAQTACGSVAIGVRAGVATWLDLHTSYGQLTNGLEAGGQPGSSEDTVHVRARTSFGDVAVHRVETDAADLAHRP